MTQVQEFAVGSRVTVLSGAFAGKLGTVTHVAELVTAEMDERDPFGNKWYTRLGPEHFRPAQPEASGDKLFESGCVLCGGYPNGSDGYERTERGTPYCLGCWRKHGQLIANVDAEITRRRSAQPAPVAESWHGFAKGERVRIHNCGGLLGSVIGGDEEYVHTKRDDGIVGHDESGSWRSLPGGLTRINSPAPTPDSPRFKVGDCVIGRGVISGNEYRGTISELGGFGNKPSARIRESGSPWLAVDTLRRVEPIQSPATPPANGADGCPEGDCMCGHAGCRVCDRAPADPYLPDLQRNTLPNGKDIAEFQAWRSTQTGAAPGLSKEAQARAALDRPLRLPSLTKRFGLLAEERIHERPFGRRAGLDKYGQLLSACGWTTDED